MSVKCICTNCAGHLEFEEQNAGEKISCPHCGFETTLFLPGSQPPDPEVTSLLRRLARRRRLVWIAIAVLGCAGIVYAMQRWGLPIVQDLLPTVESKVLLWFVLVLSCVVIPIALFWLAFPLVLVLQLRKLTQVLDDVADALVSSTAQVEQPEPEIVENNGEEAFETQEEEPTEEQR